MILQSVFRFSHVLTALAIIFCMVLVMSNNVVIMQLVVVRLFVNFTLHVFLVLTNQNWMCWLIISLQSYYCCKTLYTFVGVFHDV